MKHTKKLLGLVVAISFVMCCGFDGCGDNTPDQQQAAQQKAVSAQGNQQVGMPGVTNFTEKKLVRTLYELRDQQVPTFAYTMDMNGNLHHICDSLGYGLPYGVQFTNPQRPAEGWETHEQGNITLPQAEPNGLFMPPGAEGTWVICIDHSKPSGFAPLYSEPRVIVSPFPLTSVGEYQKQKPAEK